MQHVRLVALAALMLAGCASVEPAPADLDGLARWFWQHYEDASDPEVHEAVVKLDAQLADVAKDKPLMLEVERLPQEAVEALGLRDPVDTAKARGFLVATVIPCALGKVEPLVYAQNQDELHPDTYDRYSRTFTSDFDAYKDRREKKLTWRTEIEAAPVGQRYKETVLGGLRFVPAADGESSPFGPVILGRAWIPHPAEFDHDGNYFRQDYQSEVFFERRPGETVHLFTVWREMKVTILSTEDDGFADLQMNGFVDWDERVAGHCSK